MQHRLRVIAYPFSLNQNRLEVYVIIGANTLGDLVEWLRD
jgi:hypothetical protein